MSHLVPKVLTALPFVDRAPDPEERPDQRRIEWIRNGDCLGAAEHINDNKGELNRGPVQVQKNAVTLLENEKIIDSSIREIIERVNAHDDALGSIGDDNLAVKVQELEETVLPMSDDITANKLGIFLAGESIKKINTTIGTRPVEDKSERDVMADLYFVKKEMGNYAGKDINGEDTLELNEPTGMKARIINNGLSIQSNTRRIKQLEDNWVSSDVGALQAEILEIRTEIGQVGDAPDTTVYEWIKNTDSAQAVQDADILALKVAVGIDSGSPSTLDERISANTISINTNKTAIDETQASVDKLKVTIGDMTTPQGMEYRLGEAEKKVTELNVIVGETDQSGIRGQIQDVMNEVGSNDSPPTIKGRITVVENQIVTGGRDIATMQTQIGESAQGAETGFFKRILNLENTVDGKDGVGGLTDQVKALVVAVAEKVEEAPSDNKAYARTNKGWVEVVAGSVEEAPLDNTDYVRNNGTWKNMFEEDFIVPTGKKVVIEVGGAKIQGLAAADGKLTVGSVTQELELLGTVSSFNVGPSFSIVSGGSPVSKITITDNTLDLGAASVKTVVNTSAGNPFQVTAGGNFYDVLHTGNYADNATDTPMVRVESMWKPMTDYTPVRSKGGVYFQNNNSKLDLEADTPAAVTTSVSPELFGWSTDFDLSTDGFRYTGATSKIFQLSMQAFVKSASTDADIEFHIYKNDVDTMIRYNIKGNMWNLDNSANVSVNFPISMVGADVLKIYAVSKDKAAEITVESSTMYMMEM